MYTNQTDPLEQETDNLEERSWTFSWTSKQFFFQNHVSSLQVPSGTSRRQVQCTKFSWFRSSFKTLGDPRSYPFVITTHTPSTPRWMEFIFLVVSSGRGLSPPFRQSLGAERFAVSHLDVSKNLKMPMNIGIIWMSVAFHQTIWGQT